MSTPAAVAGAAAAFAEYKTWATDVLGVRLHYSLCVADLPAPHGRGLVANEFVPTGKDVISVPMSAMMTVELLEDEAHPVRVVVVTGREGSADSQVVLLSCTHCLSSRSAWFSRKTTSWPSCSSTN